MKLLIATLFTALIPTANAQLFFFSTAARPDSYFVLTSTVYPAALGGITGADSACLNEMKTMSFLGKGNLASITAASVRAFLCDSSGCPSLRKNARYIFATAGNATAGGAVFTTDANGVGPNDSATWSNPGYFGVTASYWNGRLLSGGSATAWPLTSDVSNCNNWSTTTGTGAGGNTGTPGATRWQGSLSCTTPVRLICIIDP